MIRSVPCYRDVAKPSVRSPSKRSISPAFTLGGVCVSTRSRSLGRACDRRPGAASGPRSFGMRPHGVVTSDVSTAPHASKLAQLAVPFAVERTRQLDHGSDRGRPLRIRLGRLGSKNRFSIGVLAWSCRVSCSECSAVDRGAEHMRGIGPPASSSSPGSDSGLHASTCTSEIGRPPGTLPRTAANATVAKRLVNDFVVSSSSSSALDA